MHSNNEKTYYFFLAATTRPRLPVVLVCCPLTLIPQWCLNPRWDLIFFNRSRSSRNLLSRPLAIHWEYFPSLISFCLFKNQSGILYWRGFCMIVTTRSSSSFDSSPALFVNHLSTVCLNRYQPSLRPSLSTEHQFLLWPSLRTESFVSRQCLCWGDEWCIGIEIGLGQQVQTFWVWESLDFFQWVRVTLGLFPPTRTVKKN